MPALHTYTSQISQKPAMDVKEVRELIMALNNNERNLPTNDNQLITVTKEEREFGFVLSEN